MSTSTRLAKILSSTFGILVFAAADGYATCSAPLGRYGGASVVEQRSPSGRLLARSSLHYSFLFNSDGSGSIVAVDQLGKRTNFTFASRGTSTHTWDGTICSGFLTLESNVQSGRITMGLQFTLVFNGKQIIATPSSKNLNGILNVGQPMMFYEL